MSKGALLQLYRAARSGWDLKPDVLAQAHELRETLGLSIPEELAEETIYGEVFWAYDDRYLRELLGKELAVQFWIDFAWGCEEFREKHFQRKPSTQEVRKAMRTSGISVEHPQPLKYFRATAPWEDLVAWRTDEYHALQREYVRRARMTPGHWDKNPEETVDRVSEAIREWERRRLKSQLRTYLREHT